MKCSSPRYQLFSMSAKPDRPGLWRFVIRGDDGSALLAAEDVEPDIQGERLELLSVVRGLEALAQPSRVTLMTPSVYVREGIRYGLEEWRSNDWQWESFGRMVPVKNSDLWRRIDRAMQFHEVECRTWRFDPSHEEPSPPVGVQPKTGVGTHWAPLAYREGSIRSAASIISRDKPLETRQVILRQRLNRAIERLKPRWRRLVIRSRRRLVHGLRELARAACI
jgi:ribonuclease HI